VIEIGRRNPYLIAKILPEFVSPLRSSMVDRDSLQTAEAFSFYQEFILQHSQNKAMIYAHYGFTLQGSVGSKDWEVFAAILLNDRARPGDGADLLQYEVKSAVLGNSFEYQYHKHHGREKLANDKTVDHLFVTRNDSFTVVEVWLVDRSKMIPIFDRWLPELLQNYAQNSNRQRFRKSVSYGFVTQQGTKLMAINAGQICSLPEP
jgi:hypothetical protein